MELDREYYYFDEKGYMVTGWHDFGGWWGYYGDDGIERHNQWVGEYWVDEYGEMAIDCWVDDDKYYVGKDGKWIPDYGVQKWNQDANGWWYSNGDGTYPKSEVKKIDGQDYYFNDQGYMQTGWQKVWGDDYYFLDNGERARCQWVGNKWIAYYGYAIWQSNAHQSAAIVECILPNACDAIGYNQFGYFNIINE